MGGGQFFKNTGSDPEDLGWGLRFCISNNPRVTWMLLVLRLHSKQQSLGHMASLGLDLGS